MKLFLFDLETTGVNPAKNGIHQISCEIVIDGTTKEAHDWKVQPNPKAIMVNGYFKPNLILFGNLTMNFLNTGNKT